ncbi:hypothetical protein EIN_371590 [Entamoeba invadens IP1]|uniref:Protein kinase domain-containing protein n=1 Tax=Entamoeba invadens IP1 TaxID=370355 RepID=A0A0A1UGK3_ENTIV|nr:hypothetical protein EIN_371590 [Entamoeba invadens IP1]ELP92747.1 hypothetical protein EIN_371590 [Entamoeba invadens IP1]|eukprot:XP_004259518.1 hypothetical protein EIN_371590 [Entamoeba invadens IP1]
MPTISYTLRDAIANKKLSLDNPPHLPHIESFIFDILNLFITKDLPKVTLEDFYVYDERGKISTFGDIYFWFDVCAPNITYFVSEKSAIMSEGVRYWLDLKKKQNVQKATITDLHNVLNQFLEEVGYTGDNNFSVGNFLIALNSMTQFTEIEHNEYYNHCKSVKLGDEIDVTELYLYVNNTPIQFDKFKFVEIKKNNVKVPMVCLKSDTNCFAELLGSGSYGKVLKGKYISRDGSTHEGVDVAIKWFIPQKYGNVYGQYFYLREVRMLSSLKREPNIAEIIGKNDENGLIVQRLYKQTLRSFIQGQKQTVFSSFDTSRDALVYIMDIVNAVLNFKEVGLFHRDYKMENTFLLDDRAYMGDFGSGVVLSLTNTGNTSLGTIGNFPPNYYIEKDRQRIDTYSVAVLLSNFFFTQTNSTSGLVIKAYQKYGNPDTFAEEVREKKQKEMIKVINDNILYKLYNFNCTQQQVDKRLVKYVETLKTDLMNIIEAGKKQSKDDLGRAKLQSIVENTKTCLKDVFKYDYKQLDHRVVDDVASLFQSFTKMYSLEEKKIENHPISYITFLDDINANKYEDALNAMYYILQALAFVCGQKEDMKMAESVWVLGKELCKFIDGKKRQEMMATLECLHSAVHSQ